MVDEQTGRGVPLVELKTVSNVAWYTDSAGLAAIDDPALMGQTVFFHVSSHGYEFERDGFGNRGARIDVTAGGSARLKIKRLNLAERLYRITGEGIYRDSVILGRPVPIRRPLLNAHVTGQDSTQRAIYRDRIYWFWGDTNRQSYPLGHFGTAAATSALPGAGRLDPMRGIDLDYFVDKDGFSKPVFAKEGDYPIWLDGLMVLKDPSGRERLVGRGSVVKSVSEVVSRRLSVFNDETKMFDSLQPIPLDAPLSPEGHTLVVDVDGARYIYCGNTMPNIRVRAEWEAVRDLSQYEGFTPLAAGERFRGADTKLERDAEGKLVWGWKRDTGPLGLKQFRQLIEAKRMTPAEVRPLPADVETRKPVALLVSSVAYNAYRGRYVAICSEIAGKTSMLGEVWYSEADRPEGPWLWARKVVTHDRYSFYNPVQHPFLEGEGGRVIFFEGTYTTTFSRPGREATARYDYNQVMYRLELSSPLLALPGELPPAAEVLPFVGF